MPKKKFYTTNEITAEYLKLSNKRKVEILENSLSLMEQSNSRTQLATIIISMGYKPSEEKTNLWEKLKSD